MRIAEARGLWEPEGIYLNTASYGLPPGPPGRRCRRRWRTGARAARAGSTGARPRRPPAPRLRACARCRSSGSRSARTRRRWSGWSPPRCRTVRASSPPRPSSPRRCGPSWPRGAASRSARVPLARAGRGDRRPHGRGGFSAVQSSTASWPTRCDRRGGRPSRGAHGRRRHAGVRLAAARRNPLRRAGVRRLQVAALAARHRVHDAFAPSSPSALTPHGAGWYAGEDPHSSYYGPPLRLADRRAPLRREPGLVLLGRDGARARAAARDRGRADP